MNQSSHTDQRTYELLNAAVDGELNAVEQRELDRLLADSESVRESYAELKQFADILENVPEREPPEYLQHVIEERVALLAQPISVRDKKPGRFERWSTANWLRTGFALAAGVVLTVSVYEMGSEPLSTQDAAHMVGTVVQRQGQGNLLDSVNIKTASLHGQVKLLQSDELFSLDLQLVSDGPAEVVVNFAGQGFEIETFTLEKETQDEVTIEDGSVNVAMNGDQHFTLQLRRTSEATQATPLKVEFFANNTLVQVAELSVSRQ